MGIKTVIRKPESLDEIEATGQYVAEPKLDGIWVSVHTDEAGKIAKIVSRHGKIKTSKGFNKFIDREIGIRDTILVGELITKSGELHIFDVPVLLGHDISKYTNERRRAVLEKLNIYRNGIILVPRWSKDFQHHFKAITAEGGEGLVIKKIGEGTHYQAGTRTPDWMKIKKAMTMDYVIMGFDTSASKSHTGMIKAIRLGLYKDGKLSEVGKVGSMKDKDRQYLSDNKLKLVGKVVEVAGNEVFPTGAMRHPYFVKLRPDLTQKDTNIEKVQMKEWAVGDDRFYEVQAGDHQMMKGNFDKMPKKVINKKKKALKKVKESWSIK